MAAAGFGVLATRHAAVDAASRFTDSLLVRLAYEGSSRVVEPRLSISTRYSSFTAPNVAQGPRRLSALPERERERAILLLSSKDKMSRPVAALMYLLTGDADAAVKVLERETNGAPSIDLAAAYYSRGVATQSMNDFAAALQALTGLEASPAAAFNRALILEQLCDRSAARDQWRAYLSMDSMSGWADEARRHLIHDAQPTARERWPADHDRLIAAAAAGDVRRTAELVDRHRYAARRLVEMELLPSWGNAWLSGRRDEALTSLRTAQTIASVLQSRSGDCLLTDAVSEINDAVSRDNGTGPLAALYRHYGTARQAIEDVKYARANEELARAAAAVHPGSAADALVSIATITARFYLYDYRGAVRLADETAARFESRSNRYLALFGHLAWGRGLSIESDWSAALREYQRALAIFERMGELEGQVAQHTNIADALDVLGETRSAEAHRRTALLLAENIDDARRLHPLLSEAAVAALNASWPAAALQFQDRLVRISRESGNALRIADAVVIRSTILQRLGRRSEALRDIDEAARLIPSIADQATRERVAGDIAAADTFAYRGVDDKRVIASTTAAIDHYTHLRFRIYIAQLLLERGRARIRLGDNRAAESDFRAGIAELEQQRREMGSAELRISYFDRAERLFSDLALSLIDRGHSAEAFDLLERSRARELLDNAVGTWREPLPIAEIQRRLPPDVVLVTYTVTSSALVTCSLRRSSLTIRKNTAAPEAALRPLIDRLASSFRDIPHLQETDLRQMSVALLSPLDIPTGERVVFVADPLFYGVPFAALSFRGRPLVEQHEIKFAPSGTLAVQLCAPASSQSDDLPSILLVSSSEGVESLHLPPLVYAAREVELVAPLYRRPRLIRNGDPAARSLLTIARDYDVLHFAGHAVVNPRNPADSALIVGNERIRAADVERMRFSRTRLVVLGGCSTNLGQMRRSEGMLSLARSFMVAGVPSVLATIAPVDDAASWRMLVAFHSAYRHSKDAAAALRAAQLQMMRSSDPAVSDPSFWGSFVVLGGACDMTTDKKEIKIWASR